MASWKIRSSVKSYQTRKFASIFLKPSCLSRSKKSTIRKNKKKSKILNIVSVKMYASTYWSKITSTTFTMWKLKLPIRKTLAGECGTMLLKWINAILSIKARPIATWKRPIWFSYATSILKVKAGSNTLTILMKITTSLSNFRTD